LLDVRGGLTHPSFAPLGTFPFLFVCWFGEGLEWSRGVGGFEELLEVEDEPSTAAAAVGGGEGVDLLQQRVRQREGDFVERFVGGIHGGGEWELCHGYGILSADAIFFWNTKEYYCIPGMTEYSPVVMPLTAISFKLPVSLREKIQAAAAAEERSESGYLRYHLAKLVEATEAEALAAEIESADLSTPATAEV